MDIHKSKIASELYTKLKEVQETINGLAVEVDIAISKVESDNIHTYIPVKYVCIPDYIKKGIESGIKKYILSQLSKEKDRLTKEIENL